MKFSRDNVAYFGTETTKPKSVSQYLMKDVLFLNFTGHEIVLILSVTVINLFLRPKLIGTSFASASLGSTNLRVLCV